jgi:hypothetical protein
MARIGVGVLSFAHGHAGMYCQQLVEDEDVPLVACWNDDEARGQAAAAQYGMRYSLRGCVRCQPDGKASHDGKVPSALRVFILFTRATTGCLSAFIAYLLFLSSENRLRFTQSSRNLVSIAPTPAR